MFMIGLRTVNRLTAKQKIAIILQSTGHRSGSRIVCLDCRLPLEKDIGDNPHWSHIGQGPFDHEAKATWGGGGE